MAQCRQLPSPGVYCMSRVYLWYWRRASSSSHGLSCLAIILLLWFASPAPPAARRRETDKEQRSVPGFTALIDVHQMMQVVAVIVIGHTEWHAQARVVTTKTKTKSSASSGFIKLLAKRWCCVPFLLESMCASAQGNCAQAQTRILMHGSIANAKPARKLWSLGHEIHATYVRTIGDGFDRKECPGSPGAIAFKRYEHSSLTLSRSVCY